MSPLRYILNQIQCKLLSYAKISTTIAIENQMTAHKSQYNVLIQRNILDFSINGCARQITKVTRVLRYGTTLDSNITRIETFTQFKDQYHLPVVAVDAACAVVDVVVELVCKVVTGALAVTVLATADVAVISVSATEPVWSGGCATVGSVINANQLNTTIFIS